LDFHHQDPEEKLFNLSTKMRAWNPDSCSEEMFQQVVLEAAKCDILCSNCHRKLHFEEKE
jgi:hypothetical protein